VYAAEAFYRHLLAIPGWQQMAVTEAAQAVQRSATPTAYATHEPAARALAAALAATTCTPNTGAKQAPAQAADPDTLEGAPTPAAAAALAFARSQLGRPYVWGGTGNGGFDCSGLVQQAYRAAGITLPRTADAQYRAGPHLPQDQPLLPGDLVFYGNPNTQISHVGLYAGAGQIIHAPTEGSVVQLAPLPTRGYAGATRPATSHVPAGGGAAGNYLTLARPDGRQKVTGEPRLIEPHYLSGPGLTTGDPHLRVTREIGAGAPLVVGRARVGVGIGVWALGDCCRGGGGEDTKPHRGRRADDEEPFAHVGCSPFDFPRPGLGLPQMAEAPCGCRQTTARPPW
jgi:cell wall-associated NlpC family hydrolase